MEISVTILLLFVILILGQIANSKDKVFKYVQVQVLVNFVIFKLIIALIGLN